MKIALGSDPNAVRLKDILKKHINDLGHEWEDFGSDDPIYPNVAFDVARSVASGKYERGILMCGTGIGMCIAANKVPGVRAALCSDVFSTERSIKSNNANIMTLGEQVIGTEHAKSLVKVWLESRYEPGTRSEPKVQRIDDYEKNKISRNPS